MSRVGKKPIPIPNGVQVQQQGRSVEVRGPKGSITMPLVPGVEVTQEGSTLQVVLQREDRQGSALFGLTRALLANNVKGVSEGFSRALEIQGTGYRAVLDGKKLVLQLGFSHPIEFPVPEGIQITVESPTKLTVRGADKGRVGQVAADIRSFRPPEPYKGKGIRYEGETVRRKAGKSAGA
jgi:large subunit ribosomal protein L6